jgi:hypothetical protein
MPSLDRTWPLAGILALSQLVAAQTTGTVGEPIATLTALRGTATVQRDGNAAAVPLAVGAQLRQGAVVHTFAEARLKLALRDGSTLTLGADTTLKMDRIDAPPTAPERTAVLTQLTGFVRAVVAPLLPAGRFEIKTPSMVAAVRGTEWIQHCETGRTEMFVVRGEVLASGVGAYADNRATLTQGQGVTFSDSAPPTPVAVWKRPKIDLFEAATRVP